MLDRSSKSEIIEQIYEIVNNVQPRSAATQIGLLINELIDDQEITLLKIIMSEIDPAQLPTQVITSILLFTSETELMERKIFISRALKSLLDRGWNEDRIARIAKRLK